MSIYMVVTKFDGLTDSRRPDRIEVVLMVDSVEKYHKSVSDQYIAINPIEQEAWLALRVRGVVDMRLRC